MASAVAPIVRLDAATTQAVVVLRTAIRSQKDLERVDPNTLSPLAKGIHTRKLAAARRDVDAAQSALASLLEDDS